MTDREMANSQHLNNLANGPSAFAEFRRAAGPKVELDFIEANLAGRDLSGFDLSGAKFVKADLRGAVFKSAVLENANFSHADLTGTDFTDANLHRGFLTNSTAKGIQLSGATLTESDFGHSDFTDTDLSGINLSRANFQACKFNGANLKSSDCHDCQFTNSRFDGACCVGANFYGACLDQCTFANADIAAAEFENSTLNNADFIDTTNAPLANNLDKTRTSSPVRNFERCRLEWPETYFDWEKLGRFGRLQLFGVSYSLLVYLITSFYVIGQYNDKIALLRKWGDTARDDGNLATRALATQIERLHGFPISWQSVALLMSTVALIIASMIYALFCPPEVKEFSSAQWQYSNNRHLFYYWPLSWKFRKARLVCAFLYCVGGGAFLIIGSLRLISAVRYALEYVG